VKRWIAVALAGAIGVATVAGGYALEAAASDSGSGSGSGSGPLGPGLVTVEVDIEHSRFSPDRVRVRPDTLVRFVLRNGDPINHEFVLGDDAVHERHQNGTELVHPPVPGEVSVGPGETGLTAYTFEDPGTLEFVCHLPGHLEYGMRGEVVVAH
jgi:uncharacterized cupredoxin-like copper-binding protein